MARTSSRPAPDSERTLQPLNKHCVACDGTMWADYDNFRTLTTLEGVIHLRLKIRRCHNGGCSRYHKPYRPEEEGRMALPQHEFGLDLIALVGKLRYGDHRSVPEIS